MYRFWLNWCGQWSMHTHTLTKTRIHTHILCKCQTRCEPNLNGIESCTNAFVCSCVFSFSFIYFLPLLLNGSYDEFMQTQSSSYTIWIDGLWSSYSCALFWFVLYYICLESIISVSSASNQIKSTKYKLQKNRNINQPTNEQTNRLTTIDVWEIFC